MEHPPCARLLLQCTKCRSEPDLPAPTLFGLRKWTISTLSNMKSGVDSDEECVGDSGGGRRRIEEALEPVVPKVKQLADSLAKPESGGIEVDMSKSASSARATVSKKNEVLWAWKKGDRCCNINVRPRIWQTHFVPFAR